MITKGHNCTANLQKWAPNNPNLDVVKVKVYAKSDQIPSIGSQDKEPKLNFGDNHGP